jgi:hypothetical protein
MPPHGSVTHWINLLQAGDHAAVRPLWERYFGQLVLRARAALRGKANLGADAEDVTLSAFDNFCRSAQQGRFPDLADRDDLWRLLVVFTAREASRLLRDASRHKCGGGQVQTEADLPDPTEASEDGGLAQVIGREPTVARKLFLIRYLWRQEDSHA